MHISGVGVGHPPCKQHALRCDSPCGNSNSKQACHPHKTDLCVLKKNCGGHSSNSLLSLGEEPLRTSAPPPPPAARTPVCLCDGHVLCTQPYGDKGMGSAHSSPMARPVRLSHYHLALLLRGKKNVPAPVKSVLPAP